ncbi:MAG: MotA/TolQ/ExbB proton channel family protein [Myxococcota bacterium]|nr:MotA/TolQ/ExbB proton channel family protein [Myxococcota bacterium]
MKSIVAVFVMLPWLPASADDATNQLEAAYKKEFAFLDAERGALQTRVAAVKKGESRAKQRRKDELQRLQEKLVVLRSRATTLEDAVTRLERDVEQLPNGNDVLESVGQQIARLLKIEGQQWALPDLKADAAPTAGNTEQPEGVVNDAANLPAAHVKARARHVSDAFTRAVEEIQNNGRVTRRAGTFFLSDGREVQGDLLNVGEIAVYGVSGSAAGALTPAGQNRFKLEPIRGASTARKLAQGQAPTQIEIFLYESTMENYEAKKQKTPVEFIDSGGVIAWVIVYLGLFGLALVVVRGCLLALSGVSVGRSLDDLSEKIQARQFDALRTLWAKQRGAGGRLLRSLGAHLTASRADLECVLEERLIAEESKLDRCGTFIIVIAAVAPLLGLLGTVTGMISTFDVITEFGTGNPKLLSGGISEALVTTELGLIVAIPMLLLGNLLNGWAQRAKLSLEQNGLHVINVTRGVLADPTIAHVVTPMPTSAKAIREVKLSETGT